MTTFLAIILTVAILKSCKAETSVLEKFLTSGFNKETSSDTEQPKENTYVTNPDDVIQFMRRAGLINPGDQVDTQQNANSPQPAAYYLPQVAQQSQLSNYVSPKRQLTPEQEQQYQLRQLQQLQQLHQQLQNLQQKKAKRQTSDRLNPEASSEEKNSAAQQDTVKKTVTKADRQGFYVNDDDDGYSGGHGGYVSANHGYPDHQDSYSGDHYGHAPVAYKPAVHVPKPSVAIKIDPIGIVRLLLAGIPKPLLNLNGKVFFGVELGKSAGFAKGVAYPPPHLGGKGVTLSLG